MRGRPSIFSRELADRLCERLADSETLRAICRDEGMPDERTVRRWALDDVGGFAGHYAKAREIGYQLVVCGVRLWRVAAAKLRRTC